MTAIVDKEHLIRVASTSFESELFHGNPCEGRFLTEIIGNDAYRCVRQSIEACFESSFVNPSHAPWFCGLTTQAGIKIDARVFALTTDSKTIHRAVLSLRHSTRACKLDALSREHEELFTRLFRESRSIMLLLDPNSGLIIDANTAACEFYGKPLHELCLMPFLALAEADMEDTRFVAATSAAPAAPIRKAYEGQHRRADGLLRDVETVFSPIRLGGKDLLNALVRDVTEVQRQQVRNAYLASLVADTQDGIIGKDLQGNIMSWNKGAQAIYGYNEAEILGKNISVLVPGHRQVHLKDLHNKVSKGEYVDRYETERIHKNGNQISISLKLSPIRGHNQNIIGISAVVRDITARKQAEEHMKRLAAAVDQAAEGIFILNPDWKIEYVNPAFSQITGFGPDETIGRTPKFLLNENDTASRAIKQAAYDEITWSGRLRAKKKDNTLYYADATVSPIKDDMGQTVNRVCLLRDVTREVALEQQLRHAQKMEAMGTLAGGIAHDFNNILAAILVNAETALLLSQQSQTIIVECLQDIVTGSLRGADLVKNILTFCRRTEEERQPLVLQSILKEALKLLRAATPATIRLKTMFDAENACVQADPTQIHQLVMNLCTNAIQSMTPKGGELTVSLCRENTTLVLSVTDAGCGIAPEYLSRVFDPFFTTKKAGEGTGLGLAIVHGIVTSHSGAISIESQPSQGTCVVVRFPIIENTLTPTPAEQPHVTTEPARILVVDDEVPIAESLTRALGLLGHTVTGVNSAFEAESMFTHAPHEYDLIITDHSMPGKSGLDLAQSILAKRPDIPVILCTGYEDLVNHEDARNVGVSAILNKPLTMTELGTTIAANVVKSPVHSPQIL
ncbi:PAS domain-containing hybrid sensor histidine kinase/response regulator [Desulfovibrio inopinatus]|uniref:PAS domain-containing hybrid sensor histidine kinase/response regulator n=1 Tax=Desulfovibrio inopinatus TaxID=102109 RepID=UPI00040407AA|nr:PAS domain S-box protein [Desulfovibrio inopinatus]